MKRFFTKLCIGLLAVIGLVALIYAFQLYTGTYMIVH